MFLRVPQKVVLYLLTLDLFDGDPYGPMGKIHSFCKPGQSSSLTSSCIFALAFRVAYLVGGTTWCGMLVEMLVNDPRTVAMMSNN